MPTAPSSLLIAALCGLVALALAWAAVRRADRRRLALRLLASLAAPLALYFTAYPPQQQVAAARAEAIVLTPGYQPDTLRQLLRRLGRGTPVWAYSTPPPTRAKSLGSLLALAEQRPALRRLHLLGEGLPTAELPALGAVPVVRHVGPTYAGFTAANWTQQLTLGQRFEVEGMVAGDSPAWVSLQAEGTGRDSVRLAAGGSFHLSYQPKVAGLARYAVVLRRAGSVATEPLPLEITTMPKPAVLLLAAVPGFEFKFLKNGLAAQGRAVALRTTVSRGLVQTEFVNQSPQPLDHLTPALLARYAVVVADAATLAALPPGESQTLRAAINQGRLGLVLLADPTPLPAAVPARADFVVQPLPVAGTVAQLLTWPNAPAPVRALLPARLRPGAALRPLITGPGGALVAAGRRYGLGAVVVSVVPETFRWALQGQAAAYASFWSQLLTAAAPPPTPSATWLALERWPHPRQPLTLRLAGPRPTPLPTAQALAGGPAVALALAQDTRLLEWSTAEYWPSAAGWHQVRGPGRTVHSFYVYDSAAWRGPSLHAGEQALAARAARASQGPPATTTVRQPWPAGWFFGLFLLAAGLLWLEEKL
ncbi:hypothetical protein E4631_08990 [Hymenobacter sp. UV11]|uniref:hypothetical protein n=1 Tax=Hymenobacter sp. UV11 TaxID=1849735 RepID=UPI00105E3A75|nr:hypothetical protein [Hymenobacter sp. UV11]TDN39801.1 hypothetical protein A8B98_17690 [Hymenobacter sp. UV11]TFZ67076.1 hypothetical protein E4631_08990 [Hymenobacter sp. UV11]